MWQEKIIDIFQFREGTEEEADGSQTPIITAGSVAWGIILRSFIIIMSIFLLFMNWDYRQYWFIALFFLWFLAIYPGYRQYQKFNQRIEIIKEETLCGSCKNFEPTSQLCKIYDEHISKTYLPCEGESWELIHFDS